MVNNKFQSYQITKVNFSLPSVSFASVKLCVGGTVWLYNLAIIFCRLCIAIMTFTLTKVYWDYVFWSWKIQFDQKFGIQSLDQWIFLIAPFFAYCAREWYVFYIAVNYINYLLINQQFVKLINVNFFQLFGTWSSVKLTQMPNFTACSNFMILNLLFPSRKSFLDKGEGAHVKLVNREKVVKE